MKNKAKTSLELLLASLLGASALHLGNVEALAQKKSDKNIVVQDTTKLKPFIWQGKVRPFMNDWSTGITLTSNIERVYGPIEAINTGAYLTSNPDSLFETYFWGADLDDVINLFQSTNPYLVTELLKNYLKDKRPGDASITLFNRLIIDGKLTEDELKLLEDGAYAYVYRPINDKASSRGILLIEYHNPELPLPKPDTLKQKERELLEEKVDTTKVTPTPIDTTKVIPEEKIKEKEYEELPKEERILTPEEEKRVKERLKPKYKFAFLTGYEYDKKNKFSPAVALRFYTPVKVSLGINWSYGTREEGPNIDVIRTPVDSLGFSGYGTNELNKDIETNDLSLEVGYDLNDRFSLFGGIGNSYSEIIENLRVYESIRDSNGLVVKANTDNYSTKKNRSDLKYYAGLEYKINRFITNIGIGRKAGNTFYLARVGVGI